CARLPVPFYEDDYGYYYTQDYW
nr:immunoglobulin heavy chain junction region [Macaca mulatta]